MALATTKLIPTKKYTFEELRWALSGFAPTLGVVEATGFEVKQREAGANMSVDVEAGNAWVKGTSNANQGIYQQLKTGKDNVAPVEANASGKPRIDTVILVVNDSSVSGVSDTPALKIVAGTATTGANLLNLTGAASEATIKASFPNFLILAYLEVPNAATEIKTAQIADRRRFLSSRPVGEILTSAVATAPAGFLKCDFSTKSRFLYPELFAAIGTSFGVGDGVNTFNLPPGEERVIVGSGAGKPLGSNGGETTHVLTEAEMPSHTHGIANFALADVAGESLKYAAGGNGVQNRPTTEARGGGAAHNNMPPYFVANHFIKF